MAGALTNSGQIQIDANSNVGVTGGFTNSGEIDLRGSLDLGAGST